MFISYEAGTALPTIDELKKIVGGMSVPISIFLATKPSQAIFVWEQKQIKNLSVPSSTKEYVSKGTLSSAHSNCTEKCIVCGSTALFYYSFVVQGEKGDKKTYICKKDLENWKKIEAAALSKKISKAMEQKQLSHTEVSEELRVSPAAVMHWINGKNRPNLFNLNRLAPILGLELKDFFPNSELDAFAANNNNHANITRQQD